MSRYRPLLLARVNGVSLTSKTDPKGMSMQHTELGEGGKELKLKIANPGLELLDDPNLQEGQIVQWRFGYPGNLSPLYQSTVYAIEPIFDANNGFTLTIYAYDGITRMLGKKRQKVWRHPTDAKLTQSWVVEQMMLEYGIETDVEPTKNYVTEIAQSGYDWDFIKDVLAPDAVALNPARSGSYRVWLNSESGILHFRPPPAHLKPKKVYRFFTEDANPSLLSFRPKLNIQRPDDTAATGTKVRDVDGSGEVVDAESTPSSAQRVRVGRYDIDPITGEFAINESGQFSEDPSSADPVSDGAGDRGDVTLADSEEKDIETDITLIGDPQLRANDIIEIRNVGKKFSGNYLCGEVTHIIDTSGYITEIIATADTYKSGGEGEGEGKGGTDGATVDNPEAEGSPSVVRFNEITGEAER